MSNEFYKIVDNTLNPARKEYKREFYCRECADIGFFKKQTTNKLWASCPNCFDGGMNYIDSSTTTMWNDTHDKIVDYLKFINLIYSAKQNIEICDGCNLNLLNTRYKELYEKDINDFSEFRKCFNDGRYAWYKNTCATPSLKDIYKFPKYDIQAIRNNKENN